MDWFVSFPAGLSDAPWGGKLSTFIPPRDAAGQQRGVHEGEGWMSGGQAVNAAQWSSTSFMLDWICFCGSCKGLIRKKEDLVCL